MMVQELISSTGADMIFNTAMLPVNPNYSKAIFWDGPDSDNMILYNSEKMMLKNHSHYSPALRNMSVYKLFINKGYLPGEGQCL